jgi:hypothetical protein
MASAAAMLPVASWFRPIPLRSSFRRRKALMQAVKSVVRRYGEADMTKMKPAPRLVNLGGLSSSGLGKHVNVGGKRIHVFAAQDIARLYRRPGRTGVSWYYSGFLPHPFLEEHAGSGSRYWFTIGQVRVICVVLNDIFAQGYRQLPAKRFLKAHQRAMAEGSKRALGRLQRDKKPKDKFGVKWDD